MYFNWTPGGRKLPVLGTLIMLLIMALMVITMGALYRGGQPEPARVAAAAAPASDVRAAASEAPAAASPATPTINLPAITIDLSPHEAKQPVAGLKKSPAPGRKESPALPDLKMTPRPEDAKGADQDGALGLPKGTLKEEPGTGWTPPGEEKRESSFISQLGTTLVGLGLVCLIAFFLLRFVGARILGKSALIPLGAGRSVKLINVLERQLIAPQKLLLLVDVAGKYLLIGMSENSLYTLGEVDGDLVQNRVREAEEAVAQPVSASPLHAVVSHYFPFLHGKPVGKDAPVKQEEVGC